MARDAVLPLAWLALLAALPGQQAAAPPDPRALALAWREQAQVPGLVLAWDGPGEQRGAVAVGHADPERRIPLTVAHRFPFGSVGKTFVAAVALQLVAERKLALDARLAEQLGAPAWLSALPNGDAVTLRMLLRHQSGIPDHVDTDGFWTAALADPDKSWRGDELAAFVAGRDPLFAPGEGWAYADTNYVLVGLAIERASGCAWHEEVVTRLLAPHALTGIEPSLGRELAQLSNGVSALAGDRLRGAMLRDGVARVNFQIEHCGGDCTARRPIWRGSSAYSGKASCSIPIRSRRCARPSRLRASAGATAWGSSSGTAPPAGRSGTAVGSPVGGPRPRGSRRRSWPSSS